MEINRMKFVRFRETQENLDEPLPLYKASVPFVKAELGNDDGGNERKSRTKIRKVGNFKVFPENGSSSTDNQPWRKKILDPGSDVYLKWNKIFLFSCLVALFIDPLFFYLPSVMHSNTSSCMNADLNLGITITCFRSVADVFYLLHIAIKFRTAYVAPSSRVFGRGDLVLDARLIARRYLRSDFFIDLIAAVPLPQIVIWSIRRTHAVHYHNPLVLIVLLQYVPRLYLIFPLSSRMIKATGLVMKTAWAGAAYNLLLYMLASHVLGAMWYFFSMERHASCLKSACKHELSPIKCHFQYMDCSYLDEYDRIAWENTTNVFSNCDPSNDITFIYGIFGTALEKNVVSSTLVEKYFFCLWWGLQTLSSYGQGLETSTFVGETAFAIVIAIVGLVLFAHLIGNMQTYLQSVTVKREEWRLKRRDTEEWMRHRQLPQALRERVRRFVQYKWLATGGVDEESILRGLPADLRRDIQRHLCLDLVRRVPFFSKMDDQLLDGICERLVSSLSTKGTYIVREGDPVTQMLFVIRGRLDSSTTNGGRTGFFNSITLRPGDFCGEELLAWVLLPKSTSNLPSSTRTVSAIEEVEAFALRAEDLKFVSNQFQRLHSKKLQHTFRFYSHQWRTWAACFIQAAWRRFRKRKMARSLGISESFSRQHVINYESTEEEEEQIYASPSPSHVKHTVGVTILASRFAAKTRRGVRRIKDVVMPKLQRPEEPDFSTDYE